MCIRDSYEIVTVEDGSIFGGPVLKGDAWGYTYTPVASSVLAGLKASDGSYYKRVQVGIKLMEGEAITEGKKSYKVSEVGLIAILNYKEDVYKRQWEECPFLFKSISRFLVSFKRSFPAFRSSRFSLSLLIMSLMQPCLLYTSILG